MKIEKKKVTAHINFSNAAKTTIAATFGLASVAAISGCNDDSDSIVGPAQGPTPASSSVNANVNESSSSVVDIPLSHEAISSSVFEELSSSATQPSKTSSSSYISSGVSSTSRPVPNSSSTAEQVSSSATPTSSAAEPASSATVPTSSAAEPGSSANETTSSSSIETPASSSSAQSPYGDCAPDDQKCIDDWRCQHNDPLCPQIYMCDDPKDPRCMMVSMVSTYELFDNA